MVNHFHGRIEGTNLVVDNPSYSAGGDCYYLVSHPHTDHTHGLSESFRKGAIHCSVMCKAILLMKFPRLQRHDAIIGHEIGETFTLNSLQSPERRGVRCSDSDSEDEWRGSASNGCSITLLDANHCAGSVMFLIKSSSGRVFLHTGDFRYSATSKAMTRALSVLSSVWIDVLYIDATFCHPSHRFPTKMDSALACADLIRAERSKGSRVGAVFVCARQIGIEPFLAELCRVFAAKLWVDPRSWKHRHCALFAETAPFLTNDPSQAMFHVPFDFCAEWRAEKQKKKSKRRMFVVPSTLWFALRGCANTPIVCDGDGLFHVLFSMHSDFFELRQFVGALNVRQLMPFNDPVVANSLSKSRNFDSVRWVRAQFKDLIESPKESRDIFVPDRAEITNNAEANPNVISCSRTALTRTAQKHKMARILAKVRVQRKTTTKEQSGSVDFAAQPQRNVDWRGAQHSDSWVHRMKKIANVSECTRSISPAKNSKPIRNAKRRRSSPRNDQSRNAKRRRVSSPSVEPLSKSPILSRWPTPSFGATLSFGVEADNDDGDAKLATLNAQNATRENDKAQSDDLSTQRSAQSACVRWSVHRHFANGRRGPSHLSQPRVRNRNVFIFAKERWNGDALNAMLCAVDALRMRRVHSVSAAKFVVVDAAMRCDAQLRGDLLSALAVEYHGGCHHIREVYTHRIFIELTRNASKHGIVFVRDANKHFLLSTLDISKQYLKSKALWPIKAKQHHRCAHCRH